MEDTSNHILPKGIDERIRPAVEVLNKHGFKTFESCEGGEGHCFYEPTVRFEGTEFDLIRAYEICQLENLPVYEVKRVFRKSSIYKDNNSYNTLPIGQVWEAPFNEITFISFAL